jgi:hypothetical protein
VSGVDSRSRHKVWAVVVVECEAVHV